MTDNVNTLGSNISYSTDDLNRASNEGLLEKANRTNTSVFDTLKSMNINTALKDPVAAEFMNEVANFGKNRAEYAFMQPIKAPSYAMGGIPRAMARSGVNLVGQAGIGLRRLYDENVTEVSQKMQEVDRRSLELREKGEEVTVGKLLEGVDDKIDYSEVINTNKQLRYGLDNFIKQMDLERTGEEGFISDLSEGAVSMAGALGLTYLTKNPHSAGVMFGLIGKESVQQELDDMGLDYEKARNFGVAGGLVEGGLEFIGIDLLFRGMKGNTALRRMTSGFITESIQEASQEAGQDIVLGMAGKEIDVTETIENAMYSGLIGGILGGGVSGVSAVDFNDSVNNLGKSGLNKDVAKSVIDKVSNKVVNSQEAVNEVTSMVKRENSNMTYQNSNMVDGVSYFQEEFNKVAQDKDMVQNLFNVQEEAQNRFTEAGVEEEISKLASVMAQSDFVMLNNMQGITKDEYLNNYLPKVIRSEEDAADLRQGVFFQDKVYTEQGKADITTPEFKNWFGDSKIKDKLGKPKIVYHGTAEEFESFSTEKSAGGEIYFTESREDIEKGEVGAAGRGRILDVYLSLKNPADWDLYDKYGKEELISRGYDGVILEEQGEPTVYIAYYPEQIKSVNNIGKFSKETADIFRQEDITGVRGYYNVSTNTINLLKSANRTTPLHEFGHAFMTHTEQLNSTFKEDSGVDFPVYQEMVKMVGEPVNGKFSVKQQEMFTRNFEQFIYNGKVKNDNIRELFKTVANWFKSIYSSTKGLGVELSERSNNFFDDILSSPYISEDRFYQTSLETIQDLRTKIEEGEKITKKDIESLREVESRLEKFEKTTALEEVVKEIKEFRKEAELPKGIAEELSIAEMELNTIQKETAKSNLKALTVSSDNIDTFIEENVLRAFKSDMSDAKKASYEKKLRDTQDSLQLHSIVKDMNSDIYIASANITKDKYNKDIQNNLKLSKPVTKGPRAVGKYDYETNKVFEQLREYNRLTQQDATEKLTLLPQVNQQDFVPSELDSIMERFLLYKSQGKRGSVELYRQVSEDMNRLTKIGKDSKEDQEFVDNINRLSNVNEAIDGIENTTGDSEKLATQAANYLLSSTGNLESYLRAGFADRFMEKWSLLLNQKKEFVAVSNSVDNVLSQSADIYGIKKTRDNNETLKKIQDLAVETDLRLVKIGAKGKGKKLSKLDIMDIYNSIKNDNIMQDYYRVYGAQQIDSIVNNLTDTDRAFADNLMDTLGNYYSKVNNIFVKLFNKDMPNVKNYWTSSAENQSIEDVFTTFIPESTTPGFTKQRGRTREPFPVNAFSKVVKYINSAEYLDNVAIQYRDLMRVVKDTNVKDSLVDKRGEKYYNDLLKTIRNSSLTQLRKDMDATETAINTLLGNWITAKIGFNPDVFLKQLISTVNYAEQMPSTEFVGGLSKGLANPKETFDFMWKNSPYLQARFNGGYSEALQLALNGANQMPKARTKLGELKSFLTLTTRLGDVGAIVYGGFPLVQYNINQGMSKEKAFEEFEKATLRSQQSPFSSSLSSWQNAKDPVRRMLFSFANTPSQYSRKIYENVMAYQNGDITKAQLSKVIMIYAVINGSIYALEGAMMKSLLTGGDEPIDEDDMKQVVVQIALTPLGGIPIIKDALGGIARASVGLPVSRGYQVPMISDMMSIAQKMSSGDYLDVIKTGGELTTGLPIKKYEKYYKTLTE